MAGLELTSPQAQEFIDKLTQLSRDYMIVIVTPFRLGYVDGDEVSSFDYYDVPGNDPGLFQWGFQAEAREIPEGV